MTGLELKKINKMGGGGGLVPENAHKSRKIKSIVPDLSEKIMACMVKRSARVSEFGMHINC